MEPLPPPPHAAMPRAAPSEAIAMPSRGTMRGRRCFMVIEAFLCPFLIVFVDKGRHRSRVLDFLDQDRAVFPTRSGEMPGHRWERDTPDGWTDTAGWLPGLPSRLGNHDHAGREFLNSRPGDEAPARHGIPLCAPPDPLPETRAAGEQADHAPVLVDVLIWNVGLALHANVPDPPQLGS